MDVNRRAGLALALAASLAATPVPAAIIVQQDFEGLSTDSWQFTALPDSYLVPGTGSDDIWGPVAGFPGQIDAAYSGAQFWGIQDITNPTASGEHRLDFAAMGLTEWTDLTLSLAFRAVGFDTGDRLSYRLNGAVENLLVGGVGGVTSNGWQVLELALGSLDRLSFSLLARQDGGGDFGGFDRVVLSGNRRLPDELSGDQLPDVRALPAPSPLAWVLPLSGLLLWRRGRPALAAAADS